jgi:hypothetical protein
MSREKRPTHTTQSEKALKSALQHTDELDEMEKEFLKSEYSALVDLYTHTEDTLQATFNFYLTLLSAIIGVVIALIQLNALQADSLFPTLAILLGFAILLGIITQDAVINKNVDTAKYAYAINALKAYMLRDSPATQRQVFYQSNSFARVSPVPMTPDPWHRLHQYFWWITELGTHQLFVSMVNSLALAVIAVVLIPGALSLPILTWRLLAFGPLSVLAFYVAHCVYAKKKFQYGIRKAQVTMTGETHKFEMPLEVES